MRFITTTCLLSLFVLAVGGCAGPNSTLGISPGNGLDEPAGESIQKVAEALEPALFLIRAGAGTGSGFLFGQLDTVVTNRHVVEGVALGETIYVRPVQKREDGFTDLGPEQPAILALKHPDLDLAIIRLQYSADGEPIQMASRDDGAYAMRGMKVLAHGFPSTLSPIVSDGIVSGHYRDPRSGAIFYLTDAALASGSSGGPVTDYQGKLVGMTTALYHYDKGETGFHWGFVLPADAIAQVVNDYQRGDVAPLNVGELVERIRSTQGTSGQIASLRKAFERVVNGSGTHRELLENLSQLMAETHPAIQIRSSEDFEEGLRAVLHMAEVSMRRSFDLARRDVPGSDQKVLSGLRTFIELLTRWHLEVTDDVGLQSPEDLENLLSTVINIYSESFREYAYRARNACIEFSGYERSDPTTKRTYEYWSAFTETEMMRRLIVMSGGMSEQAVQAANKVRGEAAFYRLRGALVELRRAQAEVGRVFERECAFVLQAKQKIEESGPPSSTPGEP